MIKNITDLANKFYFNVFAQQNTEITSILEKMRVLANNGATTVNRLLVYPEYQRSHGLLALKQILNQLSSYLNKASAGGAYNGITELLNSAQFYTSQSNAGIGYDPAIQVAREGYIAPVFYINKLIELNTKLKTIQ